jgi:hypothetical protein
MTRGILFVCAIGSAAWGMPPTPRVILPNGPAVPSPAESLTDPLKLAERIASTGKAVSNQLAEAKTTAATRSDQARLRQDLDDLIRILENQQQNTPCPKGGSDGMPPPNPMPPMTGQSGTESPMAMTGSPPPPPSSKSKSSPNSDSQSPSGPPKPTDQSTANDGGSESTKPPMDGSSAASKSDGKTAAGTEKPGQKNSPPPMLPLEESLARDFWGHLPDAPRKQMMQFFREQALPGYQKLLADYYQSLAEKERAVK